MRQDERYGRLGYAARETFNGLITMADDEGRFLALTSSIIGHLFPFDSERDPGLSRKVKTWIGEIKDSGMILFYVTDNVPYGAFRNWAKHQQINRPSPSEIPPPPDPGVAADNAVIETSAGWKQAARSRNSHGALSEGSWSPHGVLTESSIPARRRAFRSDPVVVVEELQNSNDLSAERRVQLLCELLAAHIVANDPKARPDPLGDRWRTDMRRLVADRGGDWEEVARVIRWCQDDSFWRCNVLSPSKLRKQFTQLRLKADTPRPALTAVPHKESVSDLLRAINGGQTA
jgi:hypothetical protein